MNHAIAISLLVISVAFSASSHLGRSDQMAVHRQWCIHFQESVTDSEDPSAEQVIDKYVDALGSEMHLHSLQSFTLTGNYRDSDFELHYHEGNLVWLASGGTFAYWLDKKGRFWQRNKGVLKLRSDLSTGYPTGFVNLPVFALDWQQNDSLTISNLGSRQLGDRETWCLNFESKNLESSQRFFDKENGLLLQTTASNGNLYSYQYSELDGTLFATTITLSEYGGAGQFVLFDEVSLDPNHDGIDFALPESLEAEAESSKKKGPSGR